MSRTVELAVHATDVAGLRWPSVALTDGSPDPIRVAVPVRGLDGVIDLPLDGRVAARLRGLLRFRRFGLRVLMPAFWVVNTALIAAQVLAGLAGSQLDWRLGWVVLGLDAVVLVVAVAGIRRYHVRQMPSVRGEVLVVPAVHPAAARALQQLNRDGVVTVR